MQEIGQSNKRNPTTSVMTSGDTVIGELVARQMILLPFAITHGRFGPLLDHFLFGANRP